MTQEDINAVMWNSLPEWRKDQLRREREGNDEYYAQKIRDLEKAKRELSKLRYIMAEVIPEYRDIESKALDVMDKYGLMDCVKHIDEIKTGMEK